MTVLQDCCNKLPPNNGTKGREKELHLYLMFCFIFKKQKGVTHVES